MTESDADRLDRTLTELFAPAVPDAGLEDRMIAAVRTARPTPASFFPQGRAGRAVAAVAAVLLLGVLGAIVGGGVGLPLPGGGRMDTTFSTVAARVGGSPPAPAADDLPATYGATAKRGAGTTGLKSQRMAAEAAPARDDSRLDAGLSSDLPKNNTYSNQAGGGAPPAAHGSMMGMMRPPGSGPGGAGGPAPDYFVPGQPPKPTESEGAVDPNAGKDLKAQPSGRPSTAGDTVYERVPNRQPPAGNPKADPKAAPATDPVPPNKEEPGPVRRIVIRSGEIEYEVESFDGSLATITKLVTGVKGAFVGTVNQDKLPNGKTRGSVVVRCPPEALDGLVLDLRRELGKGGEIRGVKLTSADITKQYTDLESRLRAARTMETRLLQIIKEGKGEIKQLLEAEKELGVWRTKIEETEGELRYFANLAALSTLTITLAEKEAKAAAGVTEAERVQAGVEVDDVDKAYQEVLKAVTDAKGRVTKSELKQLAAGQFNATLNFEVAPEAGGPIRDRLRQLGRVARLEIDRAQQADAAGQPVLKDAKVKRGDTVFLVQLYNLANVAPREVVTLQVAVEKVPEAYQALRDAVGKLTGRVLVAQLNEQDKQNVTAQFDFEVRRADEGAVRAALDAAGEVFARQVVRAPETDAVTDTKVLYRATFVSAARLPARETTGMTVEVENVDTTAAAFATYAAEANARTLTNTVSRETSGRATATLAYEVPLRSAAGLVERLKGSGVVKALNTSRNPAAPDGRFATARVDVTLVGGEPIVSADDGVWPPIRRGLTVTVRAMSASLMWVVIGLGVVLPWLLVGYAGYRVVRWATRPAAVPPAPGR